MRLSPTQLASFCRIRDALVSYAHADGGTGGAWLDPTIVDAFVAANPAGLDATDLALAARWRDAAQGPFFVMRHTPSCSILMGELGTFAVRGTACELADLVPETPTLVDVALVPFANHIVCATDPRFAAVEAGRASRADIDATYRGLADKSVIYSAAVMARVVRMARDSSATVATQAGRARVGRMAASARSVAAAPRKRPAAHLAPSPQVVTMPAQAPAMPMQPAAQQTVAGKLAAAMREFEAMPVVSTERLAALTRTTVPVVATESGGTWASVPLWQRDADVALA